MAFAHTFFFFSLELSILLMDLSLHVLLNLALLRQDELFLADLAVKGSAVQKKYKVVSIFFGTEKCQPFVSERCHLDKSNNQCNVTQPARQTHCEYRGDRRSHSASANTNASWERPWGEPGQRGLMAVDKKYSFDPPL